MHRTLRNLTLIIVSAVMTLVAGAILTGSFAVVVTRGISMEPTYHQGDLVVVARAASYDRGDIAAYRLPGLVVLHRIIGGDSTGFAFKGDNNESLDPTKPTGGELIGRAVMHIPHGGIWLNRATSPPMLAIFAFSLLIGGGTVVRGRRAVLRSRSRRKRATMARNADRPRRTLARPATLALPQRIAAGAIAVLGLFAATLGALAWSGPEQRLGLAEAPPAPSMTFAYSAEVPRTPAYDGTVVSSPDPVFRKLAHLVEVRFGYQGQPGSVTVTAELSSASGWRTSVPLATRTSFTEGRYAGVVHLDLNALQRRASAAAQVIGVPDGPAQVAVTPHVVTSPDAPAFRPALRLNLTPVHLSLAGPAETLVVTGAAPPPRVTLGPRALELRGQSVLSVATARTVSAYLGCLVLGALLAAVAFMLATHRPAPGGEGDNIRRRYTSLLVRVDPMPNPPGRPVVNVTDVKTLVRLAERYELLILHWARNNAETFVVFDEGTTYRYHCDANGPPVDEDADPAAVVG